ncbi:MAG: polyprenol monophosphomannose synthase [Bacteroidales bacterium]
MSNKLVIIPTYNEKENIEKIIRAVMDLDVQTDLLIIDDNSPDGTAKIVDQLQKQLDGRLFLLERSGKLGLGTAYIKGFKWALKKGYSYICEMDADFSHDPNDLTHLFNACENEYIDVAIGSRYVSGVNVVNWPMGRVLISYFASVYVRLITRMKVRDATAGFVCYRKEVLETINLDKIRFKGYAFQIEMKFTAWKYKFNVKEIPIIFTDRKEGSSKMSGGIVTEAIFGVIRLKTASWFTNYSRLQQENTQVKN